MKAKIGIVMLAASVVLLVVYARIMAPYNPITLNNRIDRLAETVIIQQEMIDEIIDNCLETGCTIIDERTPHE